ncbi:MAG: hypothetical protein ACRD9Y_25585, partial [Blastocatellia bacterium]
MKNSSTVKRASRALALALSLGLTLVATNAPGNALVFGQQAPQSKLAEGSKSTTADGLASPAELSRAFVNVAKQVKPAVVHLNVVEKTKRSARS